jgi:starch phosphorylase
MHRRIVFVENYDINVARYLVQGCDVWLNTPRRGMEASGTSGMKAALNGVLNCSILDGWWDEAYQADLGWAVGGGETYSNPDTQDEIESETLYNLIEKHIVPAFYDRDQHGIPRRWLARMKRCISTLAPAFNTNRMVQDYAEKLYLPALKRAQLLGANNLEKSAQLAHQRERLRGAWGGLRIDNVEADTASTLGVGDELKLAIDVHLGPLQPDEVGVQVYFGKLDNDGRITDGQSTNVTHDRDLGDGRHRFGGSITIQVSGRHGFAIRITPGGEMFDRVIEPGLIFWDKLDKSAQAAAAQPEPPKSAESAA